MGRKRECFAGVWRVVCALIGPIKLWLGLRNSQVKPTVHAVGERA